jgi:hypothetical protein
MALFFLRTVVVKTKTDMFLPVFQATFEDGSSFSSKIHLKLREKNTLEIFNKVFNLANYHSTPRMSEYTENFFVLFCSDSSK